MTPNQFRKLAVGDRVMLLADDYRGDRRKNTPKLVKAVFKAVHLSEMPTAAVACFETEEPRSGHDGRGLTQLGHGYYISATHPDVAEAYRIDMPANPKKCGLGPQTQFVLNHMLKGRPMTRIHADHLYRVASLSRRICDIEAAGFSVNRAQKVDETGRAYVEYTLNL